MAFVPLTFPAAHHQGAPERWFRIRAGKVLIADEASGTGDRHFLGEHDGVACWAEDVEVAAVDGADPAGASDAAAVDADGSEAGYVDLYSLFGATDDDTWAVAGRAVQIVDWARSHRFCGRCAAPTEHSAGDRSMRCPACGLLAFPRLAPAIITLVTRGEEALLARGVQFRRPMFSCLAGFVEPGETLEQAVAREIREEVGVGVGNIRYWGSQPWPFPHSLMLGFTADWTGGDIVIDPTEIAEAAWFTRDDPPPVPPPVSIARRLIDTWLSPGRSG